MDRLSVTDAQPAALSSGVNSAWATHIRFHPPRMDQTYRNILFLEVERSEPHKLIHRGFGRAVRVGCRHIERQGAHLTGHCHDFAALEPRVGATPASLERVPCC